MVVAEIFLLCTAAFFVFRTQGNPFAESASYAVISVFMLLSFLLQSSSITGASILFTTIEALCVPVSLVLILKHRACVFTTFSTIKDFGSKNPLAPIFLGACFLVMAGHAFLPVPEEFQGKVSGTLPMNHLILFHAFLRFGTPAGAGIFCFLAYLSIGFSTYALARRYSWPPTAFTTAVLVMSMPRLVVKAMFPGTEILGIATALFCILALYRSVEQPNLMDLVSLILGLLFCVSQNIAGMILGLILFVLSMVVLFRRHGMMEWKQILCKHYVALLAVVPAAVFSQSRFFLSDALHNGSRFSEISTLAFNPDGIQGALANLIRYVFESLYFSASLGLLFNRIFNLHLPKTLEKIHDFLAGSFLGEMGAAQIFHLAWPPDQMVSFGPAGFFLVIPALVYALVKAPRRLKAVAVAFFVYLYMVCLIVAWTPDNAKFLSFFYVCSGFSISFFLPPWRFTKGIKQIFQAGACLVLLFTLLTAF
jgi:hypothetical protein